MRFIIICICCFSILISITGCTGQKKEITSCNLPPVRIDTYDGYAGQGKIVPQTFSKVPERILAVSESTVDNLMFLGLEKRIAAIAGCLTDQRYPEVQYLRCFHILTEGSQYPSKEAVLGFQPDMIVSWGSLFGESSLGSVSYWHGKGIYTYVLSNTIPGKKDKENKEKRIQRRNLENIIWDLRNLSRIFRIDEEYKTKIDALENRVKALRKNARSASEDNKPTVLTIQYVYGSEYFGRPATDLTTDIIAAAGGRSLDDEVFGKHSIEHLIKKNPDVILIVDMPHRPARQKAAALKKNKLLANIPAVHNNRFFFLPYRTFYGGSPYTIDETERLKDFLNNMK